MLALLLSSAASPPTAQGTPLLVVGAGVLGRSAATQWKERTGGSVVGVTRRMDDERRQAFAEQGIEPRLRSELESEAGPTPGSGPFTHILFCASPSGNPEYAQEVEFATCLWDSSAPDSRFVFTSSAGVYAENDGGVVNEESPTEATARTAKLLEAEAIVREAGGVVVRLAGLYLLNRGAHNSWLSMEEVQQCPEGLINLVHYDDAAACAVAALLRGPRGATLLASDYEALSRHAICVEAIRAPQFSGRAIPAFVGSGGRGKICDSSQTRAILQWEPRYKTFKAFIDEVVANGS